MPVSLQSAKKMLNDLPELQRFNRKQETAYKKFILHNKYKTMEQIKDPCITGRLYIIKRADTQAKNTK